MDERITTDRLDLSPIALDDVPTIAALHMDPDVRLFLGGPVNADAAEERARFGVGAEGFWVVRLRDTATVAGLVSLTPRGEALELSYEFATPYWGRGLACEAAAAVLARSVSGQRVVAITQAKNDRSRRLLERLGFVECDRFPEFGEEQCLYERQLDDDTSPGTGSPDPG